MWRENKLKIVLLPLPFSTNLLQITNNHAPTRLFASLGVRFNIWAMVYVSIAYLGFSPIALVAQNAPHDQAMANVDSAALSLQPYRYTVVTDSSVIADSLNQPISLPYPLYRALFNQARIRHSTATDEPLGTADSLLLESVLQDTLLQGIAQRVEYDIQIPHPSPKSDLPVFSLFFGVFTLFAYTRHRYESYINPSIQAFYNVNLARQFYDDFGFSNSMASFLLSINAVIVLGSLIFLTLTNLKIALPLPDIVQIGACIGIVALLFVLKRFALLLLANIAVPTQEMVYFYLFNRDIIINTTTIVLLPLLVVAIFAQPDLAQWAWLISLVIVGISLLYSYYRGLLIAKDFVWFHKFHFFLYLCTFEVAPLLIIIKLLR